MHFGQTILQTTELITDGNLSLVFSKNLNKHNFFWVLKLNVRGI